jgi:heterodisulfide reductase subunit A-like polyferredoxin
MPPVGSRRGIHSEVHFIRLKIHSTSFLPQTNDCMQYDILIIGGGIVGLATALRLKQQKPA